MTEAKWLASSNPAAMLRLLMSVKDDLSGTFRPSDRKLRLFACAVCRHPGVWEKLSRATRVLIVAAEGAIEGTNEDLDPDDWEDVQVIGWNQCAETIPKAQQAALLREIVGNPFRPVVLPKGASRKCWDCEGYGTYLGHGPDRGNPTCDTCHGERFVHEPCPWLTPVVLSLAHAAYDECDRECPTCDGTGWDTYRDSRVEKTKCQICRGTGRIDEGTLDPQRLTVLSDALEETGCEDQECEPCRGTGWHARTVEAEEQLRQEEDSGELTLSESRGPCMWCNGTGSVGILSHLRSSGPHVRGCWALDLILGKK